MPVPDAFDQLGLEARFDLSDADIDAAYFERMAGAHPDAAGSDEESARLNEARRTLMDPERRANALLARLGGPTKEADRGLPDGFLARIMAVREDIDTALASGDAHERRRWEAWAAGERAAHRARVGALFAAEKQDVGVIRRELNAWRYIERLIEQMDPSYGGGRG